MTAIVEGLYKDGKIDLLAPPAGFQEGHVRVILIAAGAPGSPLRYLTFGKYKSGRMSTPEDFKDAQCHGEAGFGNYHD
jgi:hypothetical protein